MKTAVSIPDELLEEIDRLARRMGRSRSEIITAALSEYVAIHAPDEVTDAIDPLSQMFATPTTPSVRRPRIVSSRKPTGDRPCLDGDPGRWESDLMTQAAKKLLEEFDALHEGDQAEVLAELLRRIAATPYDLPDPEDLVAAANQLFVELDRGEQPQ
jgi:hypothetical protein